MEMRRLFCAEKGVSVYGMSKFAVYEEKPFGPWNNAGFVAKKKLTGAVKKVL